MRHDKKCNVLTFEAHKLDGMVDIMGHGKIERILRVITTKLY